jgi:hypothetical protein
MQTQHHSRPVSLIFLIGCLLFLTMGGWVGGLSFILDPTGSSLGMGTEAIKGLPVTDFFWPGIFLLAMFGVIPLLILYALLVRPEAGKLEAFSRYFHEHWSWFSALALSVILISWMVFEISIMGLIAPIQWVLSGFSLILFVVVNLPSIRKFYRIKV